MENSTVLMHLPEGDLLVIWYKLSNHWMPPPRADKTWYARAICNLLSTYGSRLHGKTLPADLHVIEKL